MHKNVGKTVNRGNEAKGRGNLQEQGVYERCNDLNFKKMCDQSALQEELAY